MDHKNNIRALSDMNSSIAALNEKDVWVDMPISEEQAKKIKKSIYMKEYRERKKRERLERGIAILQQGNPILKDLKWRMSDESKNEVIITTKFPGVSWK